ncbi:hypothetical protein [Microbacterium candidum]|uniref:Uncharacterized protein n=1 Tax=Microbacterium candidum TaxID=3041922 RepID=A0ABT7N093_9MICO|nr:hypothetical protein [Microbacterium sp. ASV49]MDL9980102.1 hypothetical protein [Microbacterium sp. ASV49]
MTTTPSTLDFDQTLPASIDQADTALAILDDWSDGNTDVADEGIARLLAATMHDGPGTALEHFAATGELDAEAALAELNEVTVPLEREGWVDALGKYIVTRGGRS